jgi:hypothetical protein
MLSAVVLAGAAPLLAVPALTPQELEQNRLRLAQWRTNPQNYARLQGDLAHFLTQPEASQERLRQLDHDLHQESPYTQARLFDVMERYADWLDRLSPADRDLIKQAGGRRQRLQAVKQIRERQWLERLPQAVRERIARAPQEERHRLIHREREKEKKNRKEWSNAFAQWEDVLLRRPVKLSDMSPAMKVFVRDILRPRLSNDEQRRLDWAQENRAQFAKVLVDLADRHPPALPGLRGPTKLSQLPLFLQQRINQLFKASKDPRRRQIESLRRKVKDAEGTWPDYGTAVAAVARFYRANNVGPAIPFELWPAGPRDLSGPVGQFLVRKLRPVLNNEQKQRLKASLGKWPDFPLALQELAKEHRLQVPWLTLPPPRDLWDLYRRKPQGKDNLPPLSRQTLRLFAQVELTAKDRADLGLTAFDRTSWKRLREEYFRRKPEEAKRLQQAERKHRKGKKPKSGKKKADGPGAN